MDGRGAGSTKPGGNHDPQVVQTMREGLSTWISLLTPLVVLLAGVFFFWRSTPATRKHSERSPIADPAWRGEVDAQLADIESRLAGLSSTLRKLHGRESQRTRRDSPALPASDKDELRRQYGILPVKRDAG